MASTWTVCLTQQHPDLLIAAEEQCILNVVAHALLEMGELMAYWWYLRVTPQLPSTNVTTGVVNEGLLVTK
ncbi:hypothetical protein P7K49_000661 [Saguinus oedipus]|uniref:Uncharacterized protein n=1 Tax=Saguinus oedipus TaxID=9490 RepID=A0ABQ9WCR6_SAGOE|nr:hypothetical protein P7K49_000661 [Saguinus oedipus]